MLKQLISTLAVTLVVGLIGTSANAAVLFYDSFNYGPTTTGIASAGNWSSSSTVLKYDANTNLTHPAVGDSSGGSMWLDFNQSRTASNSTDFTNLALGGLGAGDTVWFASLNQFVGGNTDHLIHIAGGTVSGMGFTISPAGVVSVRASKSGSGANSENTGLSVADGVHLILLSYTKGSPVDSPTNSVVRLWINPQDASSETALGAADWTFSSSLWGRDGNTLTGISPAQPSQQGRIDEIRVATTFEELNLIPEPASLGLLGLGGLLMLRRVRRA
jgi:hypothetical protein